MGKIHNYSSIVYSNISSSVITVARKILLLKAVTSNKLHFLSKEPNTDHII